RPTRLFRRAGCLGGGLLLVRGMEVEINAAQRAFFLRLTQNDRYLAVERDAVPQVWSAGFIRCDGLMHPRSPDRLKPVRLPLIPMLRQGGGAPRICSHCSLRSRICRKTGRTFSGSNDHGATVISPWISIFLNALIWLNSAKSFAGG